MSNENNEISVNIHPAGTETVGGQVLRVYQDTDQRRFVSYRQMCDWMGVDRGAQRKVLDALRIQVHERVGLTSQGPRTSLFVDIADVRRWVLGVRITDKVAQAPLAAWKEVVEKEMEELGKAGHISPDVAKGVMYATDSLEETRSGRYTATGRYAKAIATITGLVPEQGTSPRENLRNAAIAQVTLGLARLAARGEIALESCGGMLVQLASKLDVQEGERKKRDEEVSQAVQALTKMQAAREHKGFHYDDASEGGLGTAVAAGSSAVSEGLMARHETMSGPARQAYYHAPDATLPMPRKQVDPSPLPVAAKEEGSAADALAQVQGVAAGFRSASEAAVWLDNPGYPLAEQGLLTKWHKMLHPRSRNRTTITPKSLAPSVTELAKRCKVYPLVPGWTAFETARPASMKSVKETPEGGTEDRNVVTFAVYGETALHLMYAELLSTFANNSTGAPAVLKAETPAPAAVDETPST